MPFTELTGPYNSNLTQIKPRLFYIPQKYIFVLAPGRVDGFRIITGDDTGGSYQTLTVEWKIPPLLERNSEITSYMFKSNYATEVGMHF